MNKKPIIELSHVDVAYSGKVVLHDINLTVYHKDFLGIIGPNGGGKTTLIRTILGLETPIRGNISFYRDGQLVPQIKMGYLPQSGRIDRKFPISVHDVVLSGLKQDSLFGFSRSQHKSVTDILKRMGLSDLERHSIGTLSGGQLQRVFLSRALVSSPDVVILDEPDTYIDQQTKTNLYTLLEEINKESAVILISHDPGAVLQNVRSIACVNKTLHYHPYAELPEGWLNEKMECPIDLIGHGKHPHRVLRNHEEQ